MELGFPNMGAIFINQSDTDIFVTPIGLAQSSGQFKPPSTPSNYDNFMHVNLRR
jgi:hypothetical protein